MTARKILFFLATDHRFSQPEDQDLTDLIAADNNRLELLKSYHTDAINQRAYQLFKHWSHLAYMAVKYIMDKTLASVQIIELCPPFLKKISDLPSYTNQLMLGLKSKIELQGVGKEAFDLQQKAIDSVEKYFNIIEPNNALADSRQAFMRSYIDAFYVENNDNLSVARMVRYKPRGILHLHIAMETPIVPRDWAGMSKANEALDYFFSDIRSTVVDAHTAALNKVPAKKVEVATMVAKVREFLKDKDNDTKIQDRKEYNKC